MLAELHMDCPDLDIRVSSLNDAPRWHDGHLPLYAGPVALETVPSRDLALHGGLGVVVQRGAFRPVGGTVLREAIAVRADHVPRKCALA